MTSDHHDVEDQERTHNKLAQHLKMQREIYERVKKFEITPFLERLSEMLAVPPNSDALQDFANRNPDRWANAIGVLARLGGYTDKREIRVGVTIDMNKLSDSQLQQHIRQQLQVLDLAPIDYKEEKELSVVGDNGSSSSPGQ